MIPTIFVHICLISPRIAENIVPYDRAFCQVRGWAVSSAWIKGPDARDYSEGIFTIPRKNGMIAV